MQGKQTDPAGDVYRVLVGMVTFDCNFIGDIVNNDNRVEQHNSDKEKQKEREIVKKHGIQKERSSGWLGFRLFERGLSIVRAAIARMTLICGRGININTADVRAKYLVAALPLSFVYQQ